ncbi:hypothetical protein DFS34DRAFT_593846 [Phlyctochytrium arcticum]|nr:hypothetical protein DFS34DRAFT_593846 [Phlyctochytrium arcticum]
MGSLVEQHSPQTRTAKVEGPLLVDLVEPMTGITALLAVPGNVNPSSNCMAQDALPPIHVKAGTDDSTKENVKTSLNKTTSDHEQSRILFCPMCCEDIRHRTLAVREYHIHTCLKERCPMTGGANSTICSSARFCPFCAKGFPARRGKVKDASNGSWSCGCLCASETKYLQQLLQDVQVAKKLRKSNEKNGRVMIDTNPQMEQVWYEIASDEEVDCIPKLFRESIKATAAKKTTQKDKKLAPILKLATRVAEKPAGIQSPKSNSPECGRKARVSLITSVTTRKPRKRKIPISSLQFVYSKMEGNKRQKIGAGGITLEGTKSLPSIENKIHDVLEARLAKTSLSTASTPLVDMTGIAGLWNAAANRGESWDGLCPDEEELTQRLKPGTQKEGLSQAERRAQQLESRVVSITATYDGHIRRRRRDLEAEIKALKVQHNAWVREQIAKRDSEIRETRELMSGLSAKVDGKAETIVPVILDSPPVELPIPRSVISIEEEILAGIQISSSREDRIEQQEAQGGDSSDVSEDCLPYNYESQPKAALPKIPSFRLPGQGATISSQIGRLSGTNVTIYPTGENVKGGSGTPRITSVQRKSDEDLQVNAEDRHVNRSMPALSEAASPIAPIQLEEEPFPLRSVCSVKTSKVVSVDLCIIDDDVTDAVTVREQPVETHPVSFRDQSAMELEDRPVDEPSYHGSPSNFDDTAGILEYNSRSASPELILSPELMPERQSEMSASSCPPLEILEDTVPAVTEPETPSVVADFPDTADKPPISNDPTMETKLFSYIRNHRQLYQRILRYEPVDFETLYQQVIKSAGLEKCSRKVLGSFLDKKAINYVLPSTRNNGGRRH